MLLCPSLHPGLCHHERLQCRRLRQLRSTLSSSVGEIQVLPTFDLFALLPSEHDIYPCISLLRAHQWLPLRLSLGINVRRPVPHCWPSPAYSTRRALISDRTHISQRNVCNWSRKCTICNREWLNIRVLGANVVGLKEEGINVVERMIGSLEMSWRD